MDGWNTFWFPFGKPYVQVRTVRLLLVSGGETGETPSRWDETPSPMEAEKTNNGGVRPGPQLSNLVIKTLCVT